MIVRQGGHRGDGHMLSAADEYKDRLMSDGYGFVAEGTSDELGRVVFAVRKLGDDDMKAEAGASHRVALGFMMGEAGGGGQRGFMEVSFDLTDAGAVRHEVRGGDLNMLSLIWVQNCVTSPIIALTDRPSHGDREAAEALRRFTETKLHC
jgi:hypothetical protein